MQQQQQPEASSSSSCPMISKDCEQQQQQLFSQYFFSHSIRVSRSGKVETVSISDGGSSSPPNWCFFGWLLALTQLLLHGALGLVLFWVIYYLDGFGWRDNPKLLFNYHPVLMVGGFVYLSFVWLLSSHLQETLSYGVPHSGSAGHRHGFPHRVGLA